MNDELFGRKWRVSTNVQMQRSMVRTAESENHCILGPDGWVPVEIATDSNVLRFADRAAAELHVQKIAPIRIRLEDGRVARWDAPDEFVPIQND